MKTLYLFPEAEMTGGKLTGTWSVEGKWYEWFRNMVTLTGEYEMPIVAPFSGPAPERILCFYRSVENENLTKMAQHFYTGDSRLEAVYENPSLWIPRLRSSASVIGMDLSLTTEMPYALKLYNCYRNKLFMAFLHYLGINVIPNITFSKSDTYGFAFAGLPRHSMVAVNSTGLRQDREAKRIWKEGYLYMLEHLEPTHILRYGAQQECENSEISTYYDNDNYNAINYGR